MRGVVEIRKFSGPGIPPLLIVGIILMLGGFAHSECLTQRGVTTKVIFSDLLKEKRTVSVSIPPDYETTHHDYPVLYILDAEGTYTFQNAISTVQDLVEKGTIPGMILVGIHNTQRNRDMIPVAVSHRPGSGGSDRFLRFLVEELQPYIGMNYRTRDFKILYGMSNSALFCVYALLERPEAFTAYIASSPMVGHCPEYIQKKAEAFAKTKDKAQRSLYLIYGDEDSNRVTDHVPAFAEYLRANSFRSLNIRLEILAGEGHVPESSLRGGLLYLQNVY